MKIQLTVPISAHGEEITSIDIKEPIFGDFVAVGEYHKNPMEMTARLIANLADIPYPSVQKLHPKDGFEAQNFLTPFMPNSEVKAEQAS